jgi:hypothetical protein
LEVQRSFGLCTLLKETGVSLGVGLCVAPSKKSEIVRKQEKNGGNQIYIEEGEYNVEKQETRQEPPRSAFGYGAVPHFWCGNSRGGE